MHQLRLPARAGSLEHDHLRGGLSGGGWTAERRLDCGDGTAHTQDGTEVDDFDALGVMRPDESLDLVFEAGWGPDGAVCVDARRYETIGADGEAQRPPCWDALPQCETEADALEQGALISNRTHNELQRVCTPDTLRRKRPGRA